jgi:transcriptional regulator with XRE-family HTH domain
LQGRGHDARRFRALLTACLPDTISHLETGQSRRVDLDLLDRLAKALGVAPHELIGEEPRRKKR